MSLTIKDFTNLQDYKIIIVREDSWIKGTYCLVTEVHIDGLTIDSEFISYDELYKNNNYMYSTDNGISWLSFIG